MNYLKILTICLLLSVCHVVYAQYDDEYYYRQGNYGEYYSRSSSSSLFGSYDSWSTFYIEYSPVKLKSTDSHGKSTNLHGFTFGYSYAMNLGGSPVFLEMGAEATGAFSFSIHDSYYEDYYGNYGEDHSLAIYSTRIPVNLLFRWNLNDYFALIPYGGINARLNISAQDHYDGYGSYSSYDIDLFDGSLNRFQMGFQAGLKMMIGNVVSIGAGYKGDLTGSKHDKLNGLTIQLGYCF